jgi:hypothetical protein
LNARSSITAPMKFLKSRGSPTVSAAVRSRSGPFNSAHTVFGMYALDAALHFWPWYSNAPRMMAVRRALTSALGWAMMKSFPPVSPTMRG